MIKECGIKPHKTLYYFVFAKLATTATAMALFANVLKFIHKSKSFILLSRILDWMANSDLIKMWKKTWYFIWEDDSIYSWMANVVLAFVLIKFIVYPILGLLLNTNYPIVAVVSSSMEHDGSFDDWWMSRAICGEQLCSQSEFYSIYGITKEQFLSYKFKNGFRRGDIMILYGSKPGYLMPGDVLVFRAARPDPIIHRIIQKTQTQQGYLFQTKGDHNAKSISAADLNELSIAEKQLIGKAIVRIPYLGYVKIWFVESVNFLLGRPSLQ